MTKMITMPGTGAAIAACDPTTKVSRSLLGYGVIAGPTYLAVGLGEALTRDGFDLSRHPLSLLSNGGLGWIHITLLVITGLMTIAGAAGMRRVLHPGRGSTWGPRLVAAYGMGLLAAGTLVADPMDGFPAGPPATVTWHGIGHLTSAGVGFLCLIAACFVLARRFNVLGQRGWAVYSQATGVIFFAGFAALSSGSGAPAAILAFWIGVVAAWAWVSAVSAQLYRQLGSASPR